jgi:TRAP-type C4-dicarboxylate transport system permease small subunit
MVVLSCAQLLLRNLDLSGLTWSDNALRINVLWLAMFGALRASRVQNHIAINLLGEITSGALKKRIHFIVSLASAVICATAAYYGFLFILLEKEDASMAFLNVPAWLCEAIIPLALSIIALRFIFHALDEPHDHIDPA